MPPLESLSLEIDTIKKPCRHDPRGRDRHTLTNAQRLQKETEAMLTLRRYAYASGRIDSLSGAPLEALTTLVYSDKLHFQKIAVLAFPPSVVKGGGSVKREVMEPILYLLRSDDIAVHEPALYALAKLVYQDERNCRLAIELEALVDVNRLLRATTPKVHWVALAVVHEIIRMESFRIEVAKSGVIEALIPLALSRDARVPRTLAGTFLEFSHTDETRQMIVEAGAVPLLFCLLDSLVPDIQLVSAQAIEGITVDSRYLRMIAEAREGLEFTLIGFLDLSNPLLAPVAAMTLARLSLDQDFRIKILQSQVLLPLFQMMRSDYYQLIETSMLCFATLSTDLSIGSTGIEARLADRIVELVSYKGNEDLQFNSVVTLRALAHSEQNARAIVEAGAVSRVCALVSQATPPVQSETVKFLCHLTSFEGLRPRLDRTELFETLIPFSLSPKEEVWICSAGAILHMIGAKDCFSIVSAWNAPTGGLRECFVRYLCSNHGTIQLLAIVVISKWLEGGDHAMKNLITGSPEIVARVNEIANDPEACAPVPMQHRRDATSEDPRVITMVSAGLIVEMLLATEE
ncbi:armadillo-type protein [Dissophora ornata]|nr:armadillo-type protein [Dissophora ornata]